jgi:hypothetical protein
MDAEFTIAVTFALPHVRYQAFDFPHVFRILSAELLGHELLFEIDLLQHHARG